MLTDVQQAILSRPAGTRLVLLSDYDGTIAEFHEDPKMPVPSARTSRLLAKIADRTDLTFGIVSGRRVADLRTRTQLPAHVYLAGLHGMEIEVGDRRWQHPDLESAREHVRVLARQLEDIRRAVHGLLLEDKQASLAVHVRGVAPDRRADALELVDTCAAEWVANGRLRRLRGNLVLEFLPNVACHKGDATLWIARDVASQTNQRAWVLFVGDDVTDEDAFEAIDEGAGVLVGSRPSSATYQLDGTKDVNALLAWLTREG